MTAMSEETYGRYGAVKQFPAGLRVLSVDDDPVSLKVLEGLLRRCNYQPTMTRDPVMALQMLREGKDQFDLVISDVHMPDMDGFELLEHIGLEMDLPVIMLSANEEIETVMKGITNGACDYLVKPLCAKELKNIWQHIVRRRNPHLRNDRSSINSGKNYYADEKQGPAKDIRKCPGMIKYHGDVSHEIKENVVLSAQTKPRVRWTKELHGIFLKAVNQLGIDKAVPKKILDMMDVDYLNRENIASHLQKYRLYLKKVKTKVENNTIMNSNPSADASTRLSSSFNAMKEPESFQYYHGHGQYQPSRNNFSTRIDSHSPSSFGADNVMPTQSKQRDDLGMGQIDNGGSMFLKDVTSASSPLPDARQHTSSSNSYANMPADAFSSFRSCGISYSNILCGKPLEASIGNDTGNYFARIPYGGLLVHANQLPVQPSPQLRHGHSSQKNPCGDDNRDIGNFWQDAKLSDHGNTDGRESQANILNINHVTSLATASAGSMCQNKLQNQMGAILSTSEQNVSFNVASNDTSSIQLLNESSTLGITSGIGSYTLPNLQMVSYVTSTHMLNGGSEGGILSMQEQGSVDPEAVNDQPNYNNGPLIGTNELDGSCSWDDILVLNEKI